MRYSVNLKDIDDAFTRAWMVAAETARSKNTSANIQTSEDHFKKVHHAMLIQQKIYRQTGDLNRIDGSWIWDRIIFDSKSAFVLFLLEWS